MPPVEHAHDLFEQRLADGFGRSASVDHRLHVAAFNLFKVPAGISDDLASIFDPYGNAAHTALSFDMVGEDVLITGAGPIGITAGRCSRPGTRWPP